MPKYEYACKSCGEHIEVVQSFADDALTECPTCSGPLRKVFGSIGIVLKGPGFYRNDHRSPPRSEGSKLAVQDKEKEKGKDKESATAESPAGPGSGSDGSGAKGSAPSSSSSSDSSSSPSSSPSSSSESSSSSGSGPKDTAKTA